MTELKRTLARAAKEGRHGDTDLVHVNDREKLLLALLGGSGTRNPKTGRLEFYADPMGSGSDYGSTNDGLGGGYGGADPMGSGADYTPSAGWNAPDISGLGGNDFAADYAEQALGAQYQGRNVGQRVADWGSQQVRDAVANPARTGINAAVGMMPGIGALNTMAGLVFGPEYTIGGLGTSMARSATGYGQAPGVTVADSAKGQTTGAMANGDTPDAPDMGGRGSGDGGPLSGGSPLTMGANNALANALAGNSPLNQGRMTYGSLVNSYDPNGRRYVTPWAMRG